MIANPHRIQQIRRAILEALSHAAPYALPETTLRPHVDGMLRPPITEAEWSHALNPLSEQKAIVKVPNTLDPELIQWAITELGRTILATL